MSFSKPKREAGFTLIEMLIATVLLGIMMLLLTGSLRIGADSWEAGEERLNKASRMFIVESFLRRHIGSLMPVSAVNRAGEMEPAFRGTGASLSYVAPLPDQLEGGGLYRFKVYVSGQDEAKELRVTITPYRSAPETHKTEPEPIDDIAIVDPVREVRFAYYGPTGDESGNDQAGVPKGKWVESWEDYQLPTMIRIDIDPMAEEPWPSLVLAPRTLMLR
jgi:general secretion pathway protein J